MSAIILCVLCSAAFTHLMRLGQARGRSMPWLGAINYAVAAIFFAAWWACGGAGRPGWEEWVYGCGLGVVLVTAYFMLNIGIRIIGVGITQTLERLSVSLLPAVASVVVWGERPSDAQALGLAVAIVAAVLLAQPDPSHAPAARRQVFMAALVLLCIPGAGGILVKAYTNALAQHSAAIHPAFLTIAFAFASLANLLMILARRERLPSPADLLHGVVLGLDNVGGNYFYLVAISLKPGMVVFPTVGVGTMLVGAGAATLLWRERYRGRRMIALALAGVAIIMVNLSSGPR